MGRPVGRALVLIASLIGVTPARADDTPRARVPISVQGSLNGPLGTGGLSLGFETATGWGVGAGVGFHDADPGGIHTLAGLQLRAPILRRRAFELGALIHLSRGDRERQRWHEGATWPWLTRWEWRPGYRIDLAASARLRAGAFAVRLDAGAGYMLNAPRCEYIDGANAVYLNNVDCADAGIPASENAVSPWARVAPFVALAGDYDLAAGFAPAAATATEAPGTPASAPAEPAPDGRESNAWLAPTALTLPAPKVRVTLYEGFAPDFAIGLTDRIQLSAGALYIDSVGAYQAWLKVAAIKYGRVRLALLGGGIGLWGENNFAISLWGVGGAGSVCLDEACRSLLSLAAVGGVYSTEGESSSVERVKGVILSPSVVVALGARAKLVGEVHVFPSEGTVAALLVRLPFRHFGLELGLLTWDRYVLPAGSLSWTF